MCFAVVDGSVFHRRPARKCSLFFENVTLLLDYFQLMLDSPQFQFQLFDLAQLEATVL